MKLNFFHSKRQRFLHSGIFERFKIGYLKKKKNVDFSLLCYMLACDVCMHALLPWEVFFLCGFSKIPNAIILLFKMTVKTYSTGKHLCNLIYFIQYVSFFN